MKKLLLCLILILLVFPAMALSKNVVYVTSQTSKLESCADLKDNDKLFCDEIQRLGNNVTVKNENSVLTNKWDTSKAQLIFLGGVSDAVVNRSESAATFCDYVFYSDPSRGIYRKIPIISTSKNNYKNLTNTMEGCGSFLLSSLLPQRAESVLNENICDDGTFKKQKDGYVTGGYSGIVQVYTEARPAHVANLSVTNYKDADVWLNEECTPVGKSKFWYGVYPAVVTVKNFTFFGPSEPSKFTSDMWTIFDRTVLYMLSDYELKLNYVTIPKYPTADGKILVFVYPDNQNLTVNASAGKTSKILEFNSNTNLYESGEFSIGTADKINIYAQTADGVRTANLTVNTGVGAITIAPLSVAKKTSGTVSITANTENGGDVTEAKYKVWTKNLTLLAQGDLEYVGGTFQSDANVSEEDFIVEADMRSIDGKVGGAYRFISLSTKKAEEAELAVSPAEWLLSYATPKTVSQTFTFTTQSNLTGIEISKSGNISSALTFDTSEMAKNLVAGESTKLKATIDLSKISGRAIGKIIITSLELTAEIPVDAIVDKAIAGSNWLSINPKEWKAVIPLGSSQSKTFTLTSRGPYHASELKFEGTGTLAGLVSVENIPVVKAGYDTNVSITLDTKSVKEGKYTGKINMDSSIGKDSVDVEINIIPDFLKDIDDLKANLTAAKGIIESFSTKGTDIIIAQQKFSEAQAALDDLEIKLSAQDYDAVRLGLQTAKQKVDAAYLEASSLKEPFPIVLVIVVVLLIIVAALIYKFKDKIMEKFGKKKKAEIPEEEGVGDEEKYKPPSGEGGYRTEYY